MTRRLLIASSIYNGVLRLLAVACGAAVLAACHHDADAPATGSLRRVVVVYMAAQNSLGALRQHVEDSTEIMAGRRYLHPHDRVLLFIDDEAAPRLYSIDREHDKPQLLRHWTHDACSTDPATLREVLTLAGQAFPAQQYGLVLWSHADGWLPPTSTDYGGYGSPLATTHRPQSFGIDSGPDGHMSNTGAEMAVDDIARAVHGAGLHLRYIFMDCCLMQTLETAYALRQVCDYITASPAPIPSSGANYEHQLRNGLLADDPTAMARTYLADVQDEAQQTHYGDFGLVISCLRTDRLDALAAALHAALPHATLAGHAEADMTHVLHYLTYSPSYGYRPHSYDARQALSSLLPAAQQTAVLACLDDAVVWRGATEACWIGPHDWQFAHIDTAASYYPFVSMFVPQSIYTTQAARCWYGDLNQAFQSTAWYAACGFSSTGW